MRQVSAKTRVRNEVRAGLLVKWLDEACNRPDNYLGIPICEIQWDRRCTGQAIEGHEPFTRGRGGDVLDRDNVFLTCRACHDLVHANPIEATRRGFLVPSGAA